MSETQQQTFTLQHGRSKHQIPIRTKLGELQADIHAVTDVPPSEQFIIMRGKRLKLDDPDADLSELGVTSACKALLIRQRKVGAPAEARHESPRLLAVRACADRVRHLDAQMRDIAVLVDKRAKGFLDAQKTKEALSRDERAARAVEEQLMRVLEELDAVGDLAVGEESSTDRAQWRSERRGVVERVQATLRENDSVTDAIRKWTEDEFGEVEARRGKR